MSGEHVHEGWQSGMRLARFHARRRGNGRCSGGVGAEALDRRAFDVQGAV